MVPKLTSQKAQNYCLHGKKSWTPTKKVLAVSLWC